MRTDKFLQNFESLSQYLKAFAIKLTRDKNVADDLFQETALNAFRHRHKFKEDTNMKAWLSTIMKNSFINQFRKKQRRNQIQDRTEGSYFLNSFGGTVNNDGEVNVSVEELNNLINGLADGYRIPFQMAYQGYQYDEIKTAMGDIPMGTIKSRIHHARKILKNRITDLYDEVSV